MKDILELIKTRRSIRRYSDKEISDEIIEGILEAARWAPSGLNNQPWRFVIVKEKEKKKTLAGFTKYARTIENSNVAICVFLDNNSSYHREKDILGIGACIQNMLLYSYSQGIGSCWMGEILNKKEELRKSLELPDQYELMAVITLGYASESPKSSRRTLSELILKKT